MSVGRRRSSNVGGLSPVGSLSCVSGACMANSRSRDWREGSASDLRAARSSDDLESRAVVDGKVPTGGAATSTSEPTGDGETRAAEDAPDAQRIIETTRDF